MTKDQEIADLKEEIERLKEVDSEVLINFSVLQQENTALKAQVNALRDELRESVALCMYYESFDMVNRIESLLDQTPEQCLNDYRNSVIDECIEEIKLAILEGRGCYVASLEEHKK